MIPNLLIKLNLTATIIGYLPGFSGGPAEQQGQGKNVTNDTVLDGLSQIFDLPLLSGGKAVQGEVKRIDTLSDENKNPIQPGMPGAPWTENELLIAKGKIRWIMENPKDALLELDDGEKIYDFYTNLDHPKAEKGKYAILPNQAKIVRLTFHDCIPDVNGMGCNGCLNFEGIGNVFSYARCFEKSSPGKCLNFDNGTHPTVGPFKTSNNNLLWVAKVLEALYKIPNFGPKNLTHFEKSLYETGKSRADLWAYAGLVAVQHAAELNNVDCDPGKPAPCLGQIDKTSPSCAATLPPLDFKSGRTDCIPDCEGDYKYPFCTKAEEAHPNPHGNGNETVEYFKKNFKLSPKESIALMGAHTLGHPTEFNSMFQFYPWTRRPEVLNNFYYIYLANKTLFTYMSPKDLPAMKDVNVKDCNLSISAFIGNEYGEINDVAYRVKHEGRTESNGPWNWSIYSKKCSIDMCKEILTANGRYNPNSCCHWIEECKVGSELCPLKFFTCEGGCNSTTKDLFHNINMISPDMGLFYKFEVNDTGQPMGCPGLDDQQWLDNEAPISGKVQCKVNNALATETETMADVVEQYAKNNQEWLNDFSKVYVKMIENGVNASGLVKANESWFSASCNKEYICGSLK